MKRALHDISTRLHQHPRKENPPIDDLIYASTQALFQPGASMPPPPPEAPIWSHQRRDTYATPRPSWFGGYRNETSGYIPSGYNSSHFGNDRNTPEEFSMRILCPTGKIGGVIGKAGANVRQLEHNTLARIQVEDTPPEAEERIINVSSQEVKFFYCHITLFFLLALTVVNEVFCLALNGVRVLGIEFPQLLRLFYCFKSGRLQPLKMVQSPQGFLFHQVK